MKKNKLFLSVLLSFFLASCGTSGSASSDSPDSGSGSPAPAPSSEVSSEVSSEEASSESTEESSSEAPAHVHDYVHHDAVSATCTTAGNEEYYTCSGCDKIFDSDKNIISAIPTISPLGHNMDDHPAVPATCTTEGNTLYYSCDRCNKYFSDEEGENEIAEDSWVIPVQGHDYQVLHELTDEAKVKTSNECSRCHDVEGEPQYVDVVENAAGLRLAPMVHVNKEVGFSINYTFAGSSNDWGCELFRTGDFWIAAGCIGYKDASFEQGEAQDQLCDGADGQGQDGDFAISTGWNAVIGAGTYTISFGADGSILWYKGNDVALYFAPNKVSAYKNPGRYYDTAAEFVPAILDSFVENGLTVHANSGITNLSFKYDDVPYGFATVKYVRTDSDVEVSAATTYGPVKSGTIIHSVYPDVMGYDLHVPEELYADIVVPAGLNNVVKEVEYDKTSVLLTIKSYTGTDELNPGTLVGEKEIAGKPGDAYATTANEYDFYESPADISVEGTFPADDADINVFGYKFSSTISKDELTYDETIGALPDITRTTGFYVSFDLNSMDKSATEAANGDWSRLFESEHYICYTGCHGLTNGGRLYDGAHGNPSDYGEAWNALVSYGRTARITFAYFPNGDIKAYRDSKLVLYWHNDTVGANTSNTVADFAYAFIDDVHANGFKISPLINSGNEKNPNRYIKNMTVGKATDIVENATVTLRKGTFTVHSYVGNVFFGDKYLGIQVPYGYNLVSSEREGTIVSAQIEDYEIELSTNKLASPVVCDQKWNADDWSQRLFNFQGENYGIGAGDFYREVELTDFAVNGYGTDSGNNWKGMLVTIVSNMEAVGGNNAWSDKTFCLGNNGNWGTQTFPGMHVISVATLNAAWAETNKVMLTLSRQNRCYYFKVELYNTDTDPVNPIATGYIQGTGVDFALDTIYLSAEFAKFTVNSIKVGTPA